MKSNWFTRFWSGPEESPEHEETQPEVPKAPKTLKQVDMSRFISKPSAVDAVKWDGSPEGAAEVKLILEKGNFVMDSVNIAYSSDGTLDKSNTVIHYWQDKAGRKGAERVRPDRQFDRRLWHEYSLDDGWLIAEKSQFGSTYQIKKVQNADFKRNYFQLDQVTYDDFLEWVKEST